MASMDMSFKAISVIVPTYREAENIPDLVSRLQAVRDEHGLNLTLLIVDDPSGDGTEKVVETLDQNWVRLITRNGPRGLSYAVMDGLAEAEGDALLVMDADLSHPPEAIPAMLGKLAEEGIDFVIGSRYVPGASTDEDWGLLRWFNSKIATWMARPFTKAKDPMAGFFALQREQYQKAKALNPIGYKIGLELIVKCGCKRIGEVPIHFADRTKGQSKLNLAEQLRYLRHLKRLADFKFGSISHFAQFGTIGAAGAVVDVLTLMGLLAVGVNAYIAGAVAIVVAMTHNFFLNRLITFSYAKHDLMLKQYIKFVATCSVGAVVNYAIRIYLWDHFEFFANWKVLAALVGVLGGMFFNFAGSKLWIFKRKVPVSTP